MICLLCPKCQKVLGVSEAHRGGIAQCPECGQKFRIPGDTPAPVPVPAPPPPAPPPPAVASPPPVRRPAAPAAEPVAPPAEPFPDFELTSPHPAPAARPQAPVDDEYETLEVDDGPEAAEGPAFDVVADLAEPHALHPEAAAPLRLADADAPADAVADRPIPPPARDDRTEAPDEPPRRRRRRRRRSSGGFRFPEELIPGVGNFLAILIILGAVWLVLAGVALLMPPLSVFLILLGMLLAAAGNIWFLIVAFQDDTLTGVLCLLVPLYALFFLITNVDAAGRPFLVGLIGTLMVVSGAAIAGGMAN